MTTRTNLAKVTPPRIAGIVSRTRLLQHLSPGRGYRAMWISGAPGSGKTTLAADRLQQEDVTGVWYRLDSSDVDLAAFFHYLSLAARRARPRRRFRLPTLTPVYDLGVDSFARKYFRRLYSSLPVPFIIVLDDYQAIPSEAGLHGVLPLAVDEMPEGGLLVIGSRQPPPGFLARHSAGGDMQHIRGEDLLFTTAETRAFLAGRHGETKMRAIQERTQGWAAGLVLMASVGTDGPSRDGTPGLLFDYFTEEIFETIPPASQRLLSKASALREVPPAVIETLAEDVESAAIFEWLADRNLFVYRHRHDATIYAFHPLFREFLAARAGEVLCEEALAAAQRQAARCLERDNPGEAVRLYIGLEDWDAVTRVVRRSADTLITDGRSHTLDAWITSVPESARRSRPWLDYWLGRSKLHHDPAAAGHMLKQAFGEFHRQGDGQGVWRCWAAVIESRFLAQHDIAGLSHWTGMYKELCDQYPYMDASMRTQTALAMSIGLIYGETGHPEAEPWGREASRRAIWRLDPEGALKAYQMRIALAAWRGRFDEARRLVRHLRRFERAVDPPPIVRLLVDIGEALTALYTLEFHHTMALTARSEAVADDHGVHVLDGHILGIGANAAVESGDLEAARARLERLAPVAETYRHNEAAYYFNVAALYELARGATERARMLVREAEHRIALSGMPLGRFTVQVTRTRVLLGCGDRTAAVDAAHTARELSRALGSPYADFSAALLSADVLADIAIDEADTCLGHALQLGRRHGFAGSVFLDMAGHTRLLVRALQRRIETGYARELARSLPIDPALVPADLEDWPWPIRVYGLGRLELWRQTEGEATGVKAQRKPLEMLGALLNEGHDGMSGDSLADLLWPDAEGDAARRSLDTTVHRLRRRLGSDTAIRVGEGRIRLNRELVWTDLSAAETIMDNIDPRRTSDPDALIRDAQRLLNVYRGPLLPDIPWATRRRLALEARFTRWIDVCCEQLLAAGKVERALTICELALERVPHSEPLYHTLMRSSAHRDGQAGARAAYERCRGILAAELGLEPSANTERLMNRLTSAAERPATP